MVPDVESSPRFVDAKGALGQVLASEARTGDTVDVIAAADVRALLDQEANKQLVGCDDTGCLAEIADALDADLIVAGRIGETPEGVPLVALTLINARAVLVVNRVQMAWPGDPTRLGDVVQAAARVLLLEPSRRPPGGVELRGLPDGARVAVDDATVDAAALARLPIGPHEVRVQADGRAPFSTWVLVQSGTNVAVDVVLEEAGVPPIVWLAGAAGAAVVGAAGTIGVFLATSRVDTTITTKFPGIAIGTPPSKVTP